MTKFNTVKAVISWCRRYGRCIILLAVVLIQPPAWAAPSIHPLSTTNMSPVSLIQGLPPSHGAAVATSGDWQTSIDFSHANNFTHESTANEQVFLDGATTRVALSVKTGLFADADMELMVPFIKHYDGSLDSFIENWHDFFHLPQNGRKQWPRDQLLFLYKKNNVTQLEINEPVSGIGDARLTLGFKLNRHWFPHQKRLALKTAIKFPTGDAEKLTGSGGYGVFAWLTGDSATQWFQFPGLTYYRAGIAWLQDGDVMADQQRPFVAFGGIGTGARFSQRIVLQLQLDTHTSLYRDSTFNEINQYALMFTMGGNLKLTDAWNLDIAVVEDLYVHTAPDVTFQLKLNGRL
jgi:hypothetical protein